MDRRREGERGWIVRANPHYVCRIDEFLDGGFIAIGWPGLGNLAGKSMEEIKALLRTAKDYGAVVTDARTLGRNAGPLDTFVNRMMEGELILVPSPKSDDVYLGRLRGAYRYDASMERENCPHQRPVEWLMKQRGIPRHYLPESIAKKLRAQQPIIELNGGAAKYLIRRSKVQRPARQIPLELDTDGDFLGVEGDKWEQTRAQVRRNAQLRNRKVQQVLRLGNGRLLCEVPGCGFDFEAQYGELGKGFAHVHHLKPLGAAQGRRTTPLKDLAIVCANCHAMIHRGGACRSLENLIPGRKKGREKNGSRSVP